MYCKQEEVEEEEAEPHEEQELFTLWICAGGIIVSFQRWKNTDSLL